MAEVLKNIIFCGFPVALLWNEYWQVPLALAVSSYTPAGKVESGQEENK